MYRTASQFFGFYPKFIQGKKSHKNQTEKFKTKLRKIRQNPRKTLDIFALCSNKIQSQNYTFVIRDFFQLLANPLYQDLQGFHNFQKWVTYGTSGSLSPLYICYISAKNIYLRENEQMTGQSLKDIDECDNLKRIVYEVQTFSGN